MTGRIVGAVVALFGVGLLALVLNGGGPGPSSVYSRGVGLLLVLGTALCFGGSFYAVKGAVKSAPDANASSQSLATRPAQRRVTGLARGSSTESATMVVAVSISLALGGLIGLWITTWRPSSASAVAPPAAAAEAQASSLKEATIKEATGETATPAPPPAEDAPPPAESREQPPAPERITAAESEVGDAVKRRDERPDTAAAVGREDNLSSKRVRGGGAAEEVAAVAKASPARPRGRSLPCTLSASPGSIVLAGGGAGAVTLRVDETAGSARVGASTPHWADIAVFAEQQPGGGRARYTVRSVSRRPGVYSVTFRTACGSRTIPVKVTGSK